MDPNQPNQVQAPFPQQSEVQTTGLHWQTRIRRFLSVGIWIMLIFLAPPTALVFLSQDSVPGDTFYPVKRGMENVILAAASVNPATRAAFQTNLTGTRFTEAEKLLLVRSDTTGLSTFITEVQTTEQSVSTLSDPTQKQELTTKLLAKIDEYQNKLNQVQTQFQTASNIVLAPTSTPTPIPTSISQSQPSVSMPLPTSAFPTPTLAPSPTLTSTPIPTPSPTAVSLSPSPTVSLIVIHPTPTPIVTAQTSLTIFSPEQKKTSAAIDQTQKALSEIKNKLENRGQEKKEEKGQESRQKETQKNTH